MIFLKSINWSVDWWCDWNSKTQTKFKKQEGGFLWAMMAPMAASLKTLAACSLINAITGKGESRFLPLLALP